MDLGKPAGDLDATVQSELTNPKAAALQCRVNALPAADESGRDPLISELRVKEPTVLPINGTTRAGTIPYDKWARAKNLQVNIRRT